MKIGAILAEHRAFLARRVRKITLTELSEDAGVHLHCHYDPELDDPPEYFITDRVQGGVVLQTYREAEVDAWLVRRIRERHALN